MEPVLYSVGCAIPTRDYLESIREITEALRIPLIFDEIITGFRLAPGGAQQYYGVVPDLTTLGKAIANGFPLSAVVGKREIMQVTDPQRQKVSGPYVPFTGTYNANQIGMAAAKATLRILEDGKVQKYLNESTTWLAKSFNETAEELKIEAHLQHLAGEFQVYMTNREITDYRTALEYATTKEMIERFALFSRNLFNSGLFSMLSWHSHHGISAAHTKDDMDVVMQKMRVALTESKKQKNASAK
jgi:glutamate-1-semialdehyde 2,1-aminomutase